MFSRFKNAVYNAVSGLEPIPSIQEGKAPTLKDAAIPQKFRYSRPHFLQLTSDDEVQVSADHVIRPIIVPRDITKLPWNAGYAEAINAGKSARNEDQAAVSRGCLRKSVTYNQVSKLSSSPPSPSSSTTTATTIAPGHPVPMLPGQKSSTAGVNEDCKQADTGDYVRPPEENGLLDSEALNSSASVGDSIFSTPPSTPENKRKPVVIEHTVPWMYFGMFDGHAGSGVAVAAANTLHKVIQEKLQSVADLLITEPGTSNDGTVCFTSFDKKITVDSLIIGALETAFWEMDSQIARDKKIFHMSGGCTVLVALFMLGKLYLANAGDSRAVICRGNNKVIPMSFDFTPESERERIKQLGMLQPELLGDEFTHLEFIRRPLRRDLGKKMLYRDAYMTGWAYKMITQDDLKMPLIYGEGKRSRVLATIGVTRGFGDHELKAQTSRSQSTNIYIKPFLTAQPEVRVFDLMNEELTDSDVLVMGTDGLWDITSNEKAAEIVQKALDHFPANDTHRFKYRYISAAQDLVMHSRGKLKENNWRTSDDMAATIDDISVFVIPLKPYKEEYLQYKAVLEKDLELLKCK